jgi:hypothetical protein
MPQHPVTRRDLARHLAAGAAAAFTGVAPALADDDPAENTRESQPAPPLSPVQAHMTWLLQRYPSDHLTEEQLEGIRSVVARRLAQSEALRQYPLVPSDAPALVFAAYRADDPGPAGADEKGE